MFQADVPEHITGNVANDVHVIVSHSSPSQLGHVSSGSGKLQQNGGHPLRSSCVQVYGAGAYRRWRHHIHVIVGDVNQVSLFATYLLQSNPIIPIISLMTEQIMFQALLSTTDRTRSLSTEDMAGPLTSL